MRRLGRRRELFLEKTEVCKQVTAVGGEASRCCRGLVGVVGRGGPVCVTKGLVGWCQRRQKRPSVLVKGIIQCLWRSFNAAGGRVASLKRKRPLGVICVIKGHTVLSKFGVPSTKAASGPAAFGGPVPYCQLQRPALYNRLSSLPFFSRCFHFPRLSSSIF